jgi:hypothetical protein
VLFSRTTALVYGGIQSLLGWDREIGYGISTFFLLLGLLFWFPILKELGFSREKQLIFIIMVLLLEAYFGMAHKIRVDAINWFLVSLGFYLVLKGWFFPAGLVSMIAIENHPYGIALWFYVLAYAAHQIITKKWDWKKVGINAGIFALGVVVGAGYYLAFHWEWLHKFSELGGQRAGGNALYSYFWLNRFAWRHLPEAGVFLVAIVLFVINKGFKKNPFLLIFPGMMILLTFLVARGNYHYMIYILPSFLLITIEVFSEKKLGNLLLVGFLLFQIPQYGLLFSMQWGYDANRYLTTVEETVEEFLEEESEAFLYGNALPWFALKDHGYRSYGYFRRRGVNFQDNPEAYPETFVLLQNPEYTAGGWQKEQWEQNIKPFYDLDRVLKEWTEPGFGLNRISVYRRKAENLLE